MNTRVNAKTSLVLFLDLINQNTTEDHNAIDVHNENLSAYLGVIVHYHLINTETPQAQYSIIKKLCEAENIKNSLYSYVKENLASIKELINNDPSKETIEDLKNSLSPRYQRGEMISSYVEMYGDKNLCGWLFGMKSSNTNRSEFVTEAVRSFNLSHPGDINSQQQRIGDYNHKLYTLFARASLKPFPLFEYYKPTGLALTVLLVADDLKHLCIFELRKSLDRILSSIKNSLETIQAFATYSYVENDDCHDEYIVNVVQGFLIKEKAREALEQELILRTSTVTTRLA